MPETLVHPNQAKATAPPRPQKSQQGKTRQGQRYNTKFGLPVREAKHDFTIPLLQVDIDKAAEVKTKEVNDAQNFLSCVVAQAVTRVCGAERVWIGRRTAYVGFPGEGHTKRYQVDAAARATLEAWDRGEHIAEGIEIRLRAPSKQRTRAAMRQTYRKYHSTIQENKQKAKAKRKQRPSDPLHNIIRHGNLVRWS